jgi:Tfp pilus assembly protein PilN
MRTFLRVRVEATRVRAEAVRRGQVVWAGEAEHDGPGDLAEVIAQLAAEPRLPPHVSGVRVEMLPPIVQLRTLEGLPPVRAAVLPKLVANQAGRFFRRNGTPLITDATWVRAARGAPKIARAAAVEEPWVEAILEGARSAGLAVETLSPPPPSRLDLLPAMERDRRRRAAWSSTGRLAAVAAALWIGVGGIIAYRIHREERRIDARLAALGAPVEAVRSARAEIASVSAMLEAADRTEQERAAIASRLGTIAAALPDSAYLTTLSLDERAGGTLAGSARRASEFLERLERTGAAPGAELDGPVLREPRGGATWERFAVRFGAGR